MCDNFCVEDDAAQKLASLLTDWVINSYGRWMITEEGVRALIRDKWTRVAALAHKVHDEEEAKKKEIKVGDMVTWGSGVNIYQVHDIAEGYAFLFFRSSTGGGARIGAALPVSDLRKV